MVLSDGDAAVADEGVCVPAKVFHHDLFGVREVLDRSDGEKQIVGGKYKYLRENDVTKTEWKQLEPQTPFYIFSPKDLSHSREYEKYWRLTELFSLIGQGFTSHRDTFAISFSRDEANEKLDKIKNTEISSNK